jgi:hypothetical protein
MAVALCALAVLNASVVCASAVPAVKAASHPCCPTSAQPSDETCVKLGCVLGNAVVPTPATGEGPVATCGEAVEIAWLGALLPTAGDVVVSEDRCLRFHQLLI